MIMTVGELRQAISRIPCSTPLGNPVEVLEVDGKATIATKLEADLAAKFREQLLFWEAVGETNYNRSCLVISRLEKSKGQTVNDRLINDIAEYLEVL